MKTMTEFSSKVIQEIKKIPKGKVATYGQIAKLAGKPQGSRGVAWILNSSSQSHGLPWHRVLNSKGKISFPPATAEYTKQKRLLAKEGIEFGDNDQIDMMRFQWAKTKATARRKTTTKGPRLFAD